MIERTIQLGLSSCVLEFLYAKDEKIFRGVKITIIRNFYYIFIRYVDK